MRLLTPFDFVEMFPEGRTLALVGSAPSLRGAGLGEWIDSHDVVVRFNAPPLKGYENDVGSRTDLLVANPYPEGRSKPVFQAGGNHAILVFTPQTRRGDAREFAVWAGDHNVLFTYTPDLVGPAELSHQAGLTTGTYALHLLPRLCKPSSLSITGFTLFLDKTSHHYWSSETPKGVRAHDFEKEACIFIHLCNRAHCPVEVTDDIVWVANRCGLRLRKDATVRRLGDGAWAP